MIFWIWRRQNTERKIEKSTDKNVEFQQDGCFEASNFVSWDGSITNEIMLSLFLDYKYTWNPSPMIQKLKD